MTAAVCGLLLVGGLLGALVRGASRPAATSSPRIAPVVVAGRAVPQVHSRVGALQAAEGYLQAAGRAGAAGRLGPALRAFMTQAGAQLYVPVAVGQSARTRRELLAGTPSGSRVLLASAPLRSVALSYSPRRASVVLWMVQAAGASAGASAVAWWSSVRMDLLWTKAGWRALRVASIDGPTPRLDAAQASGVGTTSEVRAWLSRRVRGT